MSRAKLTSMRIGRAWSCSAQLDCTPLVPEAILKWNTAFRRIDTRFRASARYLQCLWIAFHPVTLENFVDTIRDAGDLETANRFWGRY